MMNIAIIHKPTVSVTISEIEEGHELPSYENSLVKILPEGSSGLALRYRYDESTDVLVDNYPDMTDEEVLANVLSEEQVQQVNILSELKAAKLREVRTHFEAVMTWVKSQAAPYEVSTWDTQRIEYTDWMIDNTTPTPYVSGLAEGREIPLADLMAKIGVKIAAMARIQGAQHKLETAVESASTLEELEAITMPSFGD